MHGCELVVCAHVCMCVYALLCVCDVCMCVHVSALVCVCGVCACVCEAALCVFVCVCRQALTMLDAQTNLPKVTPIFISLDPHRDTVDQMHTYAQGRYQYHN